jgi:hypothetical protein
MRQMCLCPGSAAGLGEHIFKSLLEQENELYFLT